MAKYQKDMANMALSNVLSLEALFEEKEQGSATERISSTDPSSMPEHALQEAELQKVLADGIASLRENEQMVLALYYQKNLNMKKIAQVMEVSEPRISQLHTRAVQKLRVYLEQYMKNEG